MPSKKNIAELKVINEKKDRAKSVTFIHYRGLGANQLNDLRNKIRETGGELFITKNTLLKISFSDQKLNNILMGPTAAIFAYEDEIAPLKIVADFEKDNKLPTFTGGYFDGEGMIANDVIQLSKLPSKLELQSKLVGTLAAPMSGFLNVLQGNTRNLVYALKAIVDKKSE